jgi:hypothetical protein
VRKVQHLHFEWSISNMKHARCLKTPTAYMLVDRAGTNIFYFHFSRTLPNTKCMHLCLLSFKTKWYKTCTSAYQYYLGEWNYPQCVNCREKCCFVHLNCKETTICKLNWIIIIIYIFWYSKIISLINYKILIHWLARILNRVFMENNIYITVFLFPDTTFEYRSMN